MARQHYRQYRGSDYDDGGEDDDSLSWYDDVPEGCNAAARMCQAPLPAALSSAPLALLGKYRRQSGKHHSTGSSRGRYYGANGIGGGLPLLLMRSYIAALVILSTAGSFYRLFIDLEDIFGHSGDQQHASITMTHSFTCAKWIKFAFTLLQLLLILVVLSGLIIEWKRSFIALIFPFILISLSNNIMLIVTSSKYHDNANSRRIYNLVISGGDNLRSFDDEAINQETLNVLFIVHLLSFIFSLNNLLIVTIYFCQNQRTRKLLIPKSREIPGIFSDRNCNFIDFIPLDNNIVDRDRNMKNNETKNRKSQSDNAKSMACKCCPTDNADNCRDCNCCCKKSAFDVKA